MNIYQDLILLTFINLTYMKNNIIIIPARMGSSRFPGKPLKLINGKEMIKHIYYRCDKKFKNRVFVAGCDSSLKIFCKNNNIKYVHTSKKHSRATDRTIEAALKLKTKIKFNLVTMVQGDEPLVDDKMIFKSLLPFKRKNSKYVCSNLISEIKSYKELINPNIIKVVFDNDLVAKYFTRSPIPYTKNFKRGVHYKQVCIMTFTLDGLDKFKNLKQTKLELLESVDMNRYLDNDFKIAFVKIKKITHPVDVPNDIAIVEKIMKREKPFFKIKE